MSSSSLPSTLTRTQTVALACTAFAAGAVALQLVTVYRSSTRPAPARSLSRRNAIYRRPNRANTTSNDSSADVATTEPPDAAAQESIAIRADDAVTDLGVPEGDPDMELEGQKLHELMFAISKNRAQNEGIVHRGITCDSCSRQPIVGVRYRCANCPDFDLCADCEAQDDRHIKTHIFYKIKVPAPWAGKVPEKPWYPGRPDQLPRQLPGEICTSLCARYELPAERVEAFYVQFSCIASTHWPEDPRELKLAINWDNFCSCFVPQAKKNANISYVFERIFSLFDTDGNELIGFEEFVSGLTTILDRSKRDNELCVFMALDHDQDGFVTRTDFQNFWRAYFELDKDILWDHYRMLLSGQQADEVEERRSAWDVIRGGRPQATYYDLGLAFTDRADRHGLHKHLDHHGDLVPESDHKDYVTDSMTQISPQTVTTGSWSWADPQTQSAELPDWEQELDRLYSGRQPRYLDLGTNQSLVHVERRNEPVQHPAHVTVNGKFYLLAAETNTGEQVDAFRCIFVLVPEAQARAAIAKPRELFTLAVKEACELIDDQIRRRREETARQKLFKRTLQTEFAESVGHEHLVENPPDSTDLDNPTINARLGLKPNFTTSRYIRMLLEEALNEMLDRVFTDAERLAIAIDASKKSRQKYMPEIDTFMRLFQERKGQSLSRMRETGPAAEQLVDDNDVWSEVLRPRADRFDSVSELLADVTKADIQFEVDPCTRDIQFTASNEPVWPLEPAEETSGNTDVDRDPTMPQHMPTTPDHDRVLVSKEDLRVTRFMNMLIQLTRLENAASELQDVQKAGGINLQTWKDKLQTMGEDGAQLLKWTSNWIDIVMF